ARSTCAADAGSSGRSLCTGRLGACGRFDTTRLESSGPRDQKGRAGMSDAQDRLRAWTVVDELVLEICGMTKGLALHGLEEMPAALRDAAIKSAIRTTVAVQARACDLGASLRSALGSLAELRYFLSLARRLGMIDTRRYRAACLKHERA